MIAQDQSSRQVFVPAQMRAGGPKADVCIRGVGPKLLLLEAKATPAAGTYVEILRPGLTLVGRVTRASGGRFEVATREAVSVAALVGSAGGEIQAVRPAPALATRARIQPDRSRRLGGRIEFALIGACGLVAAGTMGGAVLRTLRQPLAAVSANLQGTPSAPSGPAGRTH